MLLNVGLCVSLPYIRRVDKHFPYITSMQSEFISLLPFLKVSQIFVIAITPMHALPEADEVCISLTDVNCIMKRNKNGEEEF